MGERNEDEPRRRSHHEVSAAHGSLVLAGQPDCGESEESQHRPDPSNGRSDVRGERAGANAIADTPAPNDATGLNRFYSRPAERPLNASTSPNVVVCTYSSRIRVLRTIRTTPPPAS